MERFLKRDIARVLKKPAGTIEYYTNAGLVVPDLEPSQGRGKPRIYAERNLIEFQMIESMSRMSVSLDRIRHILEVLRQGKWSSDTALVPVGVFNVKQQKWEIDFPDFWTSGEWGVSKELVFKASSLFAGTRSSALEWFYLLDTGNRDNMIKNLVLMTEFEKDNKVTSDVEMTIWLGKIKNEAKRRVLG